MNKIKKVLCYVLNIMLLFGCTKDIEKNNYPFVFTSINVGKADALLIKSDDKVMLVDTGYDDTVQEVLVELKKQDVAYIDYLVITHYDKDHIGGVEGILENIEVGEIILPSYVGTSKKYVSMMQAISQKDIPIQYVENKTSLTVGNAYIELFPSNQEYDGTNDNNMSLVIGIDYGDTSFLLAGDSEKKRIKELLTTITRTYDVYKVPHHGKIESNSDKLLSLISPKYAIITSSSLEKADEEFLGLLEEANIKYYQSYIDGTIHIYSDGKEIKIK